MAFSSFSGAFGQARFPLRALQVRAFFTYVPFTSAGIRVSQPTLFAG